MARSWRQGLGFDIGTSFMQSSLAKEDVISIAFPFAHIDYKIKLNRLPFKLFLGAGFALNHIPTSLGSHYVSTHLIAGLIYKISPYALLKFNYTFNNGETLTGPYSFNGDTISIGVGFNLKKNKKQSVQRGPQTQSINPNVNNRRRPRQSSQPSPYQQTQKLMNELSWPTY